MPEHDTDAKKDLLQKYAQGLEEIWKRLVDQGEEYGDPLDLFVPALELTEKSLEKLLS